MYKKPVTRQIPTALRSVALALYKNNWQSIAQAVMNCSLLSCRVVDIVLKKLKDECELLCSKSGDGLLRKSSPEALLSFNWLSVASELRQEGPLFFSVLTTVGAPSRPRNVRKGVTDDSRYPAICTAAARLLKERCEFMNVLQHLLGIILFHSNATKQVSVVGCILYSYNSCHVSLYRLTDVSLACSCVCLQRQLSRRWMSYVRVLLNRLENGKKDRENTRW